uniref:Ras-GEF domain-containing protein n=1 Tax=Strigamia maritima TaxID=126957 RepID=T1JM98_STRMM
MTSSTPLDNCGGDSDTLGRDLFGVQLEVTSLLLEGERRQLRVLQRELNGSLSSEEGSLKAKELQHQELIFAINRFQQQYEQLEEEYHQAAIGVLRGNNNPRNGKVGSFDTSWRFEPSGPVFISAITVPTLPTRSQPAIGLKYTAKTRPTIFGTLTSEQIPRETRRSPQTPTSPKSPSMNSFPIPNGTNHDTFDGKERNRITDENTLNYRDGNLISGPIESLIQHLLPTADYYPDRTYLFSFLLSSRLFIKPHELLARVCQISIHQQNHISKDQLGNFWPYIVQLLSEWTETFPYDFRDERCMKQLKTITQRCIHIDSRLRKEVTQILQNLSHKLSRLDHYEELLSQINSDAANPLLNTETVTDVSEICPNPTVLAQQLTHIELERLSNIGPEEFVQAFAKENPNIETSFKDLKKTKNLESYIQWFNRLSYFVATEICMHLKKKHRARVIEYYIETAKECFNIGNFNSLMAIIAGMNMSPISRLKKTWAKVNTAKLEVLEHQMDPTSNFASYRSTLKAAMWRSEGAVDQREKIVIPFFSLLVKDLYFLNEGCANRLPNGHINCEKFWQLAKQVSQFITWKQVTCPFENCPKVLTYLLTNPVFSESALALASFECEPAENQFEKERYKTLKAELMKSPG